MRSINDSHDRLPIRSTTGRIAFALCAVAATFALRLLLLPVTGKGAPFVLFFAATLLTSVFAGARPALLSLALTLPLATYEFVVRAGYPVGQALAQACLYTIDGVVIVYLTALISRRRRSLVEVNQRLTEANQERERSLTRLRETIELAPDAYFLADLGAHYVDVNRAACSLLGYERDELLKMSIRDLIPAEQAARLQADKTAMLTPGVVVTSEWLMKRKDGTLVPTEVSANIIAEGRWQAFVRDISERKRITGEREKLLAREQAARADAEAASERLRESEERFRQTFDEAPIGMALLALDFRFLRVNRVLCEITGYSASELTRLTFKDITHPDDLDIDVDLAERLRRGDIPRYQLEKRYIRKDRSIVDIMLYGSVLPGPDHEPRYYIAQIEDITARKRAANELRLSEAKFAGIVSIAADAIISADSEQRISIFNEGAEAIFGYRRDEVIGTSLATLIPERFRARHARHFAQFAAGQESPRSMGKRLDIFGLRKNGEEFPAEASISRVAVNGSRLMSVVLRDVTERKRAEAALQRAVSIRDEVLSIVAHDLRNPLNTIYLQAQMLQRPGPQLERRDQEARSVIMRASERMERLIKDLLDVALVESGRLTVEQRPLSAAALAGEALELHAQAAAAAGVELRLDVAPDVHEVWGDRGRLLQVFENLIGNALKFTSSGGRITLAARRLDDAVEFCVADTGSGIEAEHLPHLFDRFWQARRRERAGAGLGLAIVKGIVEAHNGRIQVESTLGQGSRFRFTVPVPRAQWDRTGALKLRNRTETGAHG